MEPRAAALHRQPRKGNCRGAVAVAVAVGRLSLGDTSASRATVDRRPPERMYYRLYNASVLVLYLSVGLKQLEAETPAGQVAQFCDGY